MKSFSLVTPLLLTLAAALGQAHLAHAQDPIDVPEPRIIDHGDNVDHSADGKKDCCDNACAQHTCKGKCSSVGRHERHGFNLGFLRKWDNQVAAPVPSDCGHAECAGRGGCLARLAAHGQHGYLGMMHGNVMAVMHSGQPFIDPWARADWIAAQQAARRSWHAGYYHTECGAPLALVVPPTARMQTRTGWGVCQSTMHPIYHQFERPYPGPASPEAGGGGGGIGGSNALRPTPRWPSHTDQFGVYYIRGPW